MAWESEVGMRFEKLLIFFGFLDLKHRFENVHLGYERRRRRRHLKRVVSKLNKVLEPPAPPLTQDPDFSQVASSWTIAFDRVR